jgi:RNA polymerase sigma factor (sigma-70 family)
MLAGSATVLANRHRPEILRPSTSRTLDGNGADTVADVRTVEADPPWEGLQGNELYAACLQAARAGDRAAMNRLVVELSPLLWHVARSNGLDQHAAEDVVQSVWLALFSHLRQLDDPRALAAWLITTARREAQRVHGRKVPPVPLTDEVAQTMLSTQPSPDGEAVRSDRDRRLWSAFTKLPQRCQELLRLTVLAGRTEYRLVAESLRMPHGSIGPTRGRCLNTIRDLLEREGGTA